MASVHETAEGLHRAGLMPKRTLREFDALCLMRVQPLPPRKIRQLRLREGASQAVFARYTECLDRIDQPVGARRKAPARRVLEAVEPGGQQRPRRGRITTIR